MVAPPSLRLSLRMILMVICSAHIWLLRTASKSWRGGDTHLCAVSFGTPGSLDGPRMLGNRHP
jgi:hypothetical protein